VINGKLVTKLVEANRGRNGFTYTHYQMTKANKEVVLMANQNGFTVNLSAHNLNHADQLSRLGIAPVVTLVLADCEESIETPEGRQVRICPAQIFDDVTCQDCRACADRIPGLIIGFLPHGCQVKQAERITAGLSNQF
jgi:hypothetical protein